jgi:hypothetical protein
LGTAKRAQRSRQPSLARHDFAFVELILTKLGEATLGEATTTKLHRDRDLQRLEPLKKDARRAEPWLAAHAGILESGRASR